MADISATVTIRKNVGPAQFVTLEVVTPATSDSGDTFAITLANYGIGSFEGISGCVHTTANSVIVGETTMTTSVTTGVLTVTTGSGPGNTDKIRSYLIWGKSNTAQV